MIKSNFHTHSTFSDGKNTPEELILAAIEKDFNILGFSDHSYFYPDREYTMHSGNIQEYRDTIESLKEKYKGKIKIFCGLEQDYFSEAAVGYDYLIGSVHNVYKNGEYLTVDAGPEKFLNNLKLHYDGDYDAFAEDYFSLVADVVNKTNCDIIGHFDLVQKNSEKNGFGQSKRFLDAAEKAVKALVPSGKPFEINTGALARKTRTIPYPTPEILKMIKDFGGKITFSSDCHNKDYLDCHFAEIEKLALDIGFTQHGIITENGLEFIEIK